MNNLPIDIRSGIAPNFQPSAKVVCRSDVVLNSHGGISKGLKMIAETRQNYAELLQVHWAA
jgi:hypothetical protein